MSISPESAMRRAIALSRKGFPAPNPHVGCVLVKKGRIVGEGYHPYAGAPHAEVMALRNAGADAMGAECYVTLEPCNHTGRTGPCSLALIESGVSSVHMACADPNPRAAGGTQTLRDAGIPVTVGLLQEEARRANEIFLTAMESGRPYVVLKSAISLDGRVALPSGESKWITSEESRRRAHRLRAECGAVLVGRGTVEQDNPRLTARIPGVVNQPVRVVLDPESKLHPDKAVFGEGGPTLHVVRNPRSSAQIGGPWKEDGFDLLALLGELKQRGITGLLIEGGPKTISSFLQKGLVDRLELFVAPRVLGAGPTWATDEVSRLDEAYGFKMDSARRIGPDLHMVLYPNRQSS